MQYADSAGPVQPARNRTFVARLQNKWILYYMSTDREYPGYTARMRRLIRAYVFRILHKAGPLYALHIKYRIFIPGESQR